MLTHIVIWKYHDDVTETTREEHRNKLRRLPSLMPEVQIKTFQVGADILRLERSYHTGLVGVYQDRAALEAYTDHPDHQEVAKFGRSISLHVASVDFED
ncbi:MAG: Dabb family protein [Acidobacteria bacterium]|nr:Dabb family protein [Acidobacteriota bacterium]